MPGNGPPSGAFCHITLTSSSLYQTELIIVVVTRMTKATLSKGLRIELNTSLIYSWANRYCAVLDRHIRVHYRLGSAFGAVSTDARRPRRSANKPSEHLQLPQQPKPNSASHHLTRLPALPATRLSPRMDSVVRGTG